MLEYRDIDLDSDPIIAARCGHLFTVSSLDGVMGLRGYYNLDKNELPVSLKASNTLEFSKNDLKCCPNCRGNLRNIARYGRVVRRALLDESTKKFICWSNAQYIPIFQSLTKEQDALEDTAEEATLIGRDLRLVGDRNAQIVAIQHKHGRKRYGGIFSVRRLILGFLKKVETAEQPFQKVRDLVEATRRKNAGEDTTLAPFDFDQSLLQTRASLLRCDLTIASDVLSLHEDAPTVPGENNKLEVNFSFNRVDCEKLINDARKSSHKSQEVEGHIFWARFAALECAVAPESGGETVEGGENPMERLKSDALAHLNAAEEICKANASQTRSVAYEIEPTRKMIRDAVFYSPVTNDEMRAVVEAMANEFRSTGHWYYCVNGHPFTVGECGGPMQTSVCPQCGQPVGGSHHEPATGVTRADDIEREFGRMAL